MFRQPLQVSGALLVFLVLTVIMTQAGATGPDVPNGQEGLMPTLPDARPITHPISRPMILRGETSPQVMPVAAIMSENFEGAWPKAGWNLVDQSADDGGEYLLGKRNCHPRTGSYGGWTVGGGAQGGALYCTANYPNYADTWAEYGPFDLSQATSAVLTYYVWGQAEGSPDGCYDALLVVDSIDGTNYDHGWVHCGNLTNGSAGNGYYRATLDLSNRLGQPQVWIAFAFMSDDSITYGGITVDDISLDVVGPATATPTATRTNTPTPTRTATRPPGTMKPAAYLPSVLRGLPPLCPNDPYEPNGTFEQAWGPLPLNQDFFGYFNCAADTDRDIYYFDLPAQRRVVITLDDIPAGSSYDLTLYNCADASCLLRHSGNPGNEGERIDVEIAAGRYYVRVYRDPDSPLVSQPYRLRVATP